MEKYLRHSLIIIVLLSSLGVFAQKWSVKRANKYFDSYQYALAAPLYEKAVKSGVQPRVVYKLALCYHYQNLYKAALPHYQFLENNYPDSTFYYVGYGLLLKSLGEYQKAENVFKQFLLKKSDSEQGDEVLDLIVSCEKADDLKRNKTGTFVEGISINSEYNDFSPSVWNGNLLFTSSRKGSMGTSVYHYDDQSYLKVYKAKVNGKKSFGEPELMDEEINGSLHDGPVLFAPKFSTLFLTRNNLDFKQKNNAFENRLKLYYSNYKDGKWEALKEFQYNDESYSVGHAALPPSGRFIYFTSDRKDGYGQTDIWFCRYTPNGWTTPQNLGELVNTKGKEMFPFALNDSVLYFSSDRLIGIGGLDIYKAIIRDGQVISVENLNAPINSEKDDFGFYLEDAKSFKGYFSSNREGGKGGDDIYYFQRTEFKINALVVDSVTYDPLSFVDVSISSENGHNHTDFTNQRGKVRIELLPGDQYSMSFLKEGYRVKRIPISTYGLQTAKDTSLIVELAKAETYEFDGQVVDKATQESIPGAKVKIVYPDGIEENLTADQYGEFSFIGEPTKKYVFTASHDGYFAKTLNKPSLKQGERIILELIPITLNEPIEIEPIFYDFDQWNIRSDAAATLDKIALIMNENPNITIELSSHTDIRGTDDYNNDLSIKRAKSAINYLMSKGIDRIRLTYKFYGEKKVAIPCPPGVDCDEDVHQKNRRTEFRVTSF